MLMQDLILPDISARGAEKVLRTMVGFLKEKNLIQKERDILERLMEREKQ